MSNIKKRICGADITRTAAIAFVIILHSISLSEVLAVTSFTPVTAALQYLQYIVLTCVPLFLMLSGYLQKNKKPSGKYYLGIIPLYLSYFIISLVSVYAKAYAFKSLDTLNFGSVLYSILDFTANDYAWYFEMYIGLFLLIPFLNIMWEGISNKANRIILLMSLVIITLLPETLVSFAPYYADYKGVSFRIVPDFFTNLYPVTYYLIGAYIAEYKPKIRTLFKPLAILLPALLPTWLCIMFTNTRGERAWYMMNNNMNICVLITAYFLFAALYDIDIKNKFVCGMFARISKCSFEMYLISYIFDSYIWYFTTLHPAIKALLVFILSFVSAWFLSMILTPVNRLCGKRRK